MFHKEFNLSQTDNKEIISHPYRHSSIQLLKYMTHWYRIGTRYRPIRKFRYQNWYREAKNGIGPSLTGRMFVEESQQVLNVSIKLLVGFLVFISLSVSFLYQNLNHLCRSFHPLRSLAYFVEWEKKVVILVPTVEINVCLCWHT